MLFFILSKLLSFLSSPFLWIITIFLISIFTKDIKKKKKRFLITLFLLLFFSNNLIFSIAKSTIEIKPIKTEKLSKYNYGIVLGGFTSYDKEFKRIKFHKSSDRLWQAILLYKENVIKKIVISGGSSKIFNNKIKESDIVKEYLIKIGINKNDIIIENQSRNTFENALYTSKLKNVKKSTVLLITSSLHMLRATKCFKKQGFTTVAFSTGYNSIKDANFSEYIIPNLGTLFYWNDFLHEIFGILAYKITGKI